MRLIVEIEQETDGRWLAEIVDLPGVMAYGRTPDEARARTQALALRVIARDRKVNDCQARIENEVRLLLAVKRGLTKDLRNVMIISKMTDALEKIGNEIAGFAGLVKSLFDRHDSPGDAKLLTDIIKIGGMIKIMLDKKFIRENPELVRETLRKRGPEPDLDAFLGLETRRLNILRELELVLFALFPKDGNSSFEVGRLNVSRQPRLEPRNEAIIKPF